MLREPSRSAEAGRLSTKAFPIRGRSEVVTVSSHAGRLARELGLDARRAMELAIVVSELASNIVKHGIRGEIVLTFDDHWPPQGEITVEAHDVGPPIRALAQQLRQDGIDAWVDQFTPFAAQGWDVWMLDEIARAGFVLCVITKNYAARFLGHTAPGVGRGVKWEGSVITDVIYQADGKNPKFIPVFFDRADAAQTPFPLSRHVDLGNVLPDGYEAIYRLLTDQPSRVPVAIGTRRELSPALSQPKVYRHRRDRGNLPRLPYFFGREDQLQTISRALEPTARTWIVLIDGAGGVG